MLRQLTRRGEKIMGAQSRHPSTAIATAVSSALRALSICVTGMLLGTPAAPAQTLEPAPLSSDIPRQPLAEALAAFARQTGLQFIYESDLVRNRKSGAAVAGMSANDALRQILVGTGLRFQYLNAHSIGIVPEKAHAHSSSAAVHTGDETRPLEQVIVTASRRAENVQDLPMSVQVLTADTLASLNAATFDDYVRYLPGVTSQGVGPGQNNIYVRGLSTPGPAFLQASGTLGAFPSVAVYLDEQSVQLLSRNLDIYLADIDRIEILEGPQGTLFGAGAEAGVVRYITNAPKLNASEATLNAGLATTEHGGPSNSFDVILNVPIIADQLAVRAVIYTESRGGYIDNIPAVFARANTDLGIGFAGAGGQVPANSVAIDNFAIAGGSINPVTYQGGRAAALYQFAEAWSLQLTESYQDMVADGVFTEMAANSLGAPLPELGVQLYNPSYDKDRFENTALTLEGRLDALKILYTGSYLARNVEQVQDYTAYARGPYVDYYQCINPGLTPATARCFSPSSTWHDAERNTHLSQELRVQTPNGRRLRGLGGLFYEKDTIQEETDWFYLTATPYFHPIGPPTGYYTVNGSPLLPNGSPVQWSTPGAVFVSAPVTSINPSIRPPTDGYFRDITRGYTQKALYGSVDFDLTRTLTLTAGTRYFDIDTSAAGSSVGSDFCQLIYNPSAPNPCVNHSTIINLNALNLAPGFSGFTSRASLSWKITDEAMLYYTWSQGLRAGGANRGGEPGPLSPLTAGPAPYQSQALAHGGYFPPLYFGPDTLTNNELGWKSTWLGGQIQWNGALYQENWSNVQTAVATFNVTGGSLFFDNAGDYRVRGLETSVVARVAPAFTVAASTTWNQSELVSQAPFYWADGTPINFSSLQTASGQKLSNPTGALGSPLAGAPPFQGNVRVRYDFLVNGYSAFVTTGAIHQSHSYASTDHLTLDLQGNSIAYDLPAFSEYDAGAGVSRGPWFAQASGENLSDSRSETYANYRQWYKGVTVSRPRTISLRVTYKFGGS
jgi:iron complex outermembrane recepter protein